MSDYDDLDDLGPELRADGTIRFQIDDQRVRLRMPRLGELRHLKESRAALLDQLREEAHKHDDEEARVRGLQEQAKQRLRDAKDEDQLQESGRELRALVEEVTRVTERITNEMEQTQQRLVIEWFRSAVRLLSRPKGSDVEEAFRLPDDDDDLPVWAGGLSTTTDWIEHWMTHPKRPGA